MMHLTVYSTGPTCRQCRLTCGRLNDLDVPHVVIDLTLDDNAAAREYVTEELGYSQAPVVCVDGEPEHHWSGFRPDLIDRLVQSVER